MSVEGMHNYFIQKLSRDDSQDKVSADELNGLHRSSSQRTLKTRLVHANYMTYTFSSFLFSNKSVSGICFQSV